MLVKEACWNPQEAMLGWEFAKWQIKNPGKTPPARFHSIINPNFNGGWVNGELFPLLPALHALSLTPDRILTDGDPSPTAVGWTDTDLTLFACMEGDRYMEHEDRVVFMGGAVFEEEFHNVVKFGLSVEVRSWEEDRPEVCEFYVLKAGTSMERMEFWQLLGVLEQICERYEHGIASGRGGIRQQIEEDTPLMFVCKEECPLQTFWAQNPTGVKF